MMPVPHARQNRLVSHAMRNMLRSCFLVTGSLILAGASPPALAQAPGDRCAKLPVEFQASCLAQYALPAARPGNPCAGLSGAQLQACTAGLQGGATRAFCTGLSAREQAFCQSQSAAAQRCRQFAGRPQDYQACVLTGSGGFPAGF